MLSTEQSIEVATKVWGWTQDLASKPSEPNLTVWEKPHTEFACWEHDIVKEVNSWQGFGRTVEAMAERYKNNAYQYNLRVRISNSILRYVQGEITKEELWQETNLAALEALK
jgi:hypothetical protein